MENIPSKPLERRGKVSLNIIKEGKLESKIKGISKRQEKLKQLEKRYKADLEKSKKKSEIAPPDLKLPFKLPDHSNK